jgi:hypothetical protein
VLSFLLGQFLLFLLGSLEFLEMLADEAAIAAGLLLRRRFEFVLDLLDLLHHSQRSLLLLLFDWCFFLLLNDRSGRSNGSSFLLLHRDRRNFDRSGFLDGGFKLLIGDLGVLRQLCAGEGTSIESLLLGLLLCLS